MIVIITLKEKVLNILEENRNSYISGEYIAKTADVSRASVWKAINSLKESGIEIDAVTNKGYCLSSDYDFLSLSGIKSAINCLDFKIEPELLKSVESTNKTARERAQSGVKEGYTVISSQQTGGHGRFGRHFYSPENCGIYMSIVLRPKISAADSVFITTAAAVAVCEAIESVSGKNARIKWVNDVLVDSKKVCGILTEAAFNIESGLLDYAILGIGINAYEPKDGFADEIKNVAGAVFSKADGGAMDRLTGEVLNNFFKYYKNLKSTEFLEAYRSHCIIPKNSITVISNGNKRSAYIIGVDDDFRLHVRYTDGTEEHLNSGEISTKLN